MGFGYEYRSPILSWIGGIVNLGLPIASFIVELKDSGKTAFNQVRTVSQPGSSPHQGFNPAREGPELSDKDFLPVFLLCFLVRISRCPHKGSSSDELASKSIHAADPWRARHLDGLIDLILILSLVPSPMQKAES